MGIQQPGAPGLGVGVAEGEETRPRRLVGHGIDQLGLVQPSGLSGHDGLLETAHQAVGVIGDAGGGQARLVQHPAHAVETVERAGVEGRAPKAAGVGAVLDVLGAARQFAELGEPAGCDGPGTEAVGGVQKARALARHGVFVAAGDVEDPVRHR